MPGGRPLISKRPPSPVTAKSGWSKTATQPVIHGWTSHLTRKTSGPAEGLVARLPGRAHREVERRVGLAHARGRCAASGRWNGTAATCPVRTATTCGSNRQLTWSITTGPAGDATGGPSFTYTITFLQPPLVVRDDRLVGQRRPAGVAIRLGQHLPSGCRPEKSHRPADDARPGRDGRPGRSGCRSAGRSRWTNCQGAETSGNRRGEPGRDDPASPTSPATSPRSRERRSRRPACQLTR